MMTTTLRTRSLSIGGNRLVVLIVLVLLLQLALTAVFFNFLQNQHKASSQSDFQTQADTFGDAIQKGIDRNLNVVQSVSGLFATSDEVRRSDFRAFAQWPLSRYPDIHALEWIPRIKNSDRVSYEGDWRETLPGFQITERNNQGRMVGSRQRAEYYPVHYVEPLMRNDTAIGYDLGSEPVRLAALERARDTREAVTTGEIALVQESGQQSGFLVIQPIYQNNAPHETIEERGQSLVGFAIGAFHVADMVEAAIEELPQASVNIQIIDESPSESEVVLYSGQGAESEILAGADSLKNSGDLYLRKPLDIPGREWSLFITPTPEYSVRLAWEAWGVLAAGLIITAMLIAYLATLINYGSKTRKLVAELMTVNNGLRTEVAERKLVEDEIQSFAKFPSEDPNPIIRLGNDGTVLYANPSAIPLLAERGLEVGQTAAKEAMAWIGEALAKSSRAEIEIEFQDGVFSFEVEPVPNAGYVNVYGRNVTAKRRAEEALKESETRLMSMIASAAAGFLLIDSDGTIESFNPAAERLLGYSADEMIGQNVKIIIPKPYHGRHDGYIANYRRTGEAKIIGAGREVFARRKDGVEIPIDLTVSEIRLSNRTLFTGLIRDISDWKRAEEELRSLAANLERSNQELQEFASVASHDLQEPLRKVRAFGDLLKSGYAEVLEEEGQDYLERMLKAAERMQTLIDDLLSLSRVTTQGQSFVPVDLNAVVQEVSEDLEIALDSVGGRVIVSPLPVIEGDSAQLRRLLQNLISNSLKFHSIDEPPIINIYSEYITTSNGHNGQDASHADFARLIVEDNGIGFDPKYADRIFNIFQRLHSRNKYEGTGIGLAVCRKIVERHGGEIVATSKSGEGAAFVITLPVNQNAGGKSKWKETVNANP